MCSVAGRRGHTAASYSTQHFAHINTIHLDINEKGKDLTPYNHSKSVDALCWALLTTLKKEWMIQLKLDIFLQEPKTQLQLLKLASVFINGGKVKGI